MRLDLSRALNVVAAVLVGVLVAMLLGPRLSSRAASEGSPSVEELHAAALALDRAAAPERDAQRVRLAWERALGAFTDPEARELYERGIALLAARRVEEADTVFAVALRRERERDMEW